MSNDKKPKKLGYRFLRTLFSPLIRVLWPTWVYGKENLIRDSRVVYVANHYSALDIVPLAVHLFKKDINVVMKEEAYNAAKWFFNIIGCVPIKRGEADMRAIKDIMHILNADRPLVIFPEGKRNAVKDSADLAPFKSGAVTFAMRTQSPVVPILIYRTTQVFRKNYFVIGKPICYENFKNSRDKELPNALTLELEERFRAMRQEFENRTRK